MKKSLLFLITLSLSLILACSEDTSGDTTKGFTEIDFSTTYTLNANKSFNINGIGSDTGNHCNVIYYSGTVNSQSYTGFAVKNGDEKLTMYSTGDVTIPGQTFTIHRQNLSNSVVVTTTNVTAVTDIDGLKRIEFNGAVPITGFGTIASGDYIKAQIY